jgi:hypothetical protein
MRILIAGGSGFLGRALAGRLAQDGHEVVVLSRDVQATQETLPPGVQAARWDARTSAGWAYLADGAGAIINLAGENIGAQRWSGERKKRILVSRLEAGAAIVAAIERARRKPEVLVQQSGVGYYGDRGDDLLTESEPPQGAAFESQVTVEWERSTQSVESLGVRRPVLRTAVVIERGSPALERMALPIRLFAGGPVGRGTQGFTWIHRDDWVEAVRFVLGDPRVAGPINVAAPQPVTLEEFGRALARVLGRPYWMPTPELLVRLVFGEMGDVVLQGRKVIPARLEEWGFKFRYPTVDKALRAIYGR